MFTAFMERAGEEPLEGVLPNGCSPVPVVVVVACPSFDGADLDSCECLVLHGIICQERDQRLCVLGHQRSTGFAKNLVLVPPLCYAHCKVVQLFEAGSSEYEVLLKRFKMLDAVLQDESMSKK